MRLAYLFIRALVRFIIGICFKEVTIIGEENIPEDGPLIISGTHNSQYMDAAMLVLSVRREVNFVIAAKSARLKTLGFFLQFMNIIPTERPIDKKIKGIGLITAITGDIVEGKGTKFDEQIKPGDCFKVLSNGKELVISEVLSANKVKLRKSPGDLSNVEESFDILPKLNQDVVFKNVYSSLNNGKCIGIFPEGGSHDQTQLLPLKAGACVFTWGCYQMYKKKVQMVEVGINYFKAHGFRSKVVINIGKPRTYNFDDSQLSDSGYKRQCIGNMLKELKVHMETVKITAPSYNELVNLNCAKEVYIPEDVKLESDTDFKLLQKFANAYSKLKDFPEVKKLMTDIEEFRQDLKKYGLKVSEVKNLKIVFGPYTLIYMKKLIFFVIMVS